MRIVIDMQGAQSESRFRGIGRYSNALAQAIVRNAKEHEVWLVLNAAFEESTAALCEQFADLLPRERIQIFGVPGPVAEIGPHNLGRTKVAEKIREFFLREINPDVVLVTSLFEGFVDDAVTSVSAFNRDIKTAVILYDLIPYFDQQRYLPTILQSEHYLRKLESLKRSDLLLAISESAREEGIRALGINKEQVLNISCAADKKFHPAILSKGEREALFRRYGITRKAVMYAPGGFDRRKNFHGLLLAYSMLPTEVRATHQLVIASKIQADNRQELTRLSRGHGLRDDEVVITGYLSDDDLIALYTAATLFVFPSLHEGFGLPALEAMSCGTPTIGANTSSVPEVIGWAPAMFDPSDPSSIASVMTLALTDEAFRQALRENGARQIQRFSWDESACKALAAMEALHEHSQLRVTDEIERPRLAFISPVPPERSGISFYSSDLLPALANYYDIDVITDQAEVHLPQETSGISIRSVAWFKEHASVYERIVYQFGNSPFHSHMFELLDRHPGVVVLHDFFMSGVLAYEETIGSKQAVWSEALYHSHGYRALKARFEPDTGVERARQLFPANLEVLQHAKSLVFHSAHAAQMMTQWYGTASLKCHDIIPLVRKPKALGNRFQARRELHLQDDDFVICSFGFLDATKLNHRLLDAWLLSTLAKDSRCILVFVGENHGGAYGKQLLAAIDRNGLNSRIRITGWVNHSEFDRYLSVADVAVQLRCMSRGETSAAVLDCLGYGLPTIANANGSMADLPDDTVLMLPDEFTDQELVGALERLHADAVTRTTLAGKAREFVLDQHSPAKCATLYAQAIEKSYKREPVDVPRLIAEIVNDSELTSDTDLRSVARALAFSIKPKPALRQLLVDVTSIARNDLKTGIERVVRAQLLELIKSPPPGVRVEPVYLSNQGGEQRYWYARAYTCEILGIPSVIPGDCPVDVANGDIYYCADYAPHALFAAQDDGLYARWRSLGVSINFLIHDLLPVLKPEFFPDGAAKFHSAWLLALYECADRLICISEAVADELKQWVLGQASLATQGRRPAISIVKHGANLDASAPSMGYPEDAAGVLQQLAMRPTFLMVGTIEPRKGHLQSLEAFELLWERGVDVNLVIIGNEGWKALPDAQRRTIPTIVSRLAGHPQLGKKLFWLRGISDEYLGAVYSASACLLAASEGEGFGLPLIEAARYKLPVIARDIPVFREVAGNNAAYFTGLDAGSVVASVAEWLEAREKQGRITIADMNCHTWEQNARDLTKVIVPAR